jgi:TolB protein
MLHRISLLLVVACAAASSALAQTDIYLKTERVGRGKVPILVNDIEADSPREREPASLISNVIRNDLDLSGLFETLRAGRDTAADTIAGASFVGRLAPDGTGHVLDATLQDISSKEVIFSKRYRFADDATRMVAHTVSDEIVYFLVGERGIATTRILFRRARGGSKNIYIVDYDGHGERQLTRDELVTSPLWLDGDRFCYSSDKRQNWDCYLVDLRKGTKYLMTQWRGINIAGSYFAPRDEIAMTLSVGGNHEIYVLHSSGAIVRRLTKNRGIDISPSWSPNGSEIAFVSDRGGTPQIYVMDRYGGNVRRLTRTGSYNQSPAWSPSGDIIAYASREGNIYRLKLISPDGLVEDTVLEDFSSYEDPSWAPDGRHIAATEKGAGKVSIVIIDIDTKEKRLLTEGDFAKWSPLAAERGAAASSR